jgi:hypothetical protein
VDTRNLLTNPLPGAIRDGEGSLVLGSNRVSTFKGSTLVLNPLAEDRDVLFADGSHLLGDDHHEDHRR